MMAELSKQTFIEIVSR